MDPDILVIDEPTSQLDPIGTEDIFNVIRIMKERGKTVLLVEHKMDLIAEYADNILVLHEGSLVMQGPVREVFSDSKYSTYNIQYPYVTEVALNLKEMGVPLKFIPIQNEELPKSLEIEWEENND